MSILIGLHIARALKRKMEIVKAVDDRIFPIVAKNGVERFPFIMYDTNGASGTKTKDGLLDDVATVSLSVVAKTYSEALEIGHAVRYALDGYCPTYEEFRVRSTGNIVYNDEYIGDIDAFSLNLSVEFKTEDL